MAKKPTDKTVTGANLGFEEKLWATADKLRGHMDAAEYKHVVLGLVFLKYISDAFQELHDTLAADHDSDPEDRDEYLAENVFWVPKAGRWAVLQAHAKQPSASPSTTPWRRSRKTTPLSRGSSPKTTAEPPSTSSVWAN